MEKRLVQVIWERHKSVEQSLPQVEKFSKLILGESRQIRNIVKENPLAKPSCVFFQPEFVGPFFPPCKGGSAVPFLPKIQGLTPAWIFFEGFVHIHSKVIIYHQKVIFSHKRLCPKEHILFFGRCSLRPRVSRVDGWQKSNMVNFCT